MAVVVQIEEPMGLFETEEVTKIEVQLSDVANFSNILAEVETYPDDFSVTIDYELTDGDVYYVRARFTTNLSGVERWSLPVSFTATNSQESLVKLTRPITAYPPIVSMNMYEQDQAPQTNFTLRIDLESTNVNNIVSTTWLIEDIDGKCYTHSLDDERNITEYKVSSILEPNRVYIAKVSVETISRSVSEFASFIFKTAGMEGDFFLIPGSVTGKTKVNGFSSNIPVDYDHTEIEIYDDKTMTYSGTANGPVYDVSNLTTIYTSIVRARAVYTDDSKSEWRYLYKFMENNCTLPLPLPAILGCTGV
jgi:hypothetical protein